MPDTLRSGASFAQSTPPSSPSLLNSTFIGPMSSSLFSCKSHRSSKNYKKLLISSPLQVSPPTMPLPTFPSPRLPSWTVVLTAKYDFQALAKPEISLRRGDHVRLLERPGNGWLNVQLIHEIGEGLVPALYLEITVNDPIRPVSREWLNDFQTMPTIRNQVLLVKLKCAYLSGSNNFWYRMDAVFASGRIAICAMFYEDFVSLHSHLLASGLSGDVRLPLKPFTLASNSAHTKRGEAMARPQTLMLLSFETFVQAVLQESATTPRCVLGDYIDHHCTRKIYLREDEKMPREDAVAKLLVAGSLQITAPPVLLPRVNSFSPTAPLPPIAQAPGHRTTVKTSVGSLDSTAFGAKPPYKVSNVKYLSYLNQSLPLLSQFPPINPKEKLKEKIHEKAHEQWLKHEKRKLYVRSSSLTTNLSFGSLIDAYAAPLSDSLEPEDSGSTDEFQDLLDTLPTELTTMLAQKQSHSSTETATSRLPLMAPNSTFSSRCTSSSVATALTSHEPSTPTLQTLAGPAPLGLLNEYDLSPLEPKKHGVFFSPGSAETLQPLAFGFHWDPLSPP